MTSWIPAAAFVSFLAIISPPRVVAVFILASIAGASVAAGGALAWLAARGILSLLP